MPHRIAHPDGWPRPRGYSNGMSGRGEILAIAGQIAWNDHEEIVSDDFAAQFEQALANVVTVIRSAGGLPCHLISLTIYVTDRQEYLDNLKPLGKIFRDHLERHFPAMALVEVKGLVEARAKVEIQGLAVLPEVARGVPTLI
ncbi:MAG: RidA family protein [Nannocystaceae bacterium]